MLLGKYTKTKVLNALTGNSSQVYSPREQYIGRSRLLHELKNETGLRPVVDFLSKVFHEGIHILGLGLTELLIQSSGVNAWPPAGRQRRGAPGNSQFRNARIAASGTEYSSQ
jgi:hypothetical protein